MKTLEEFVKEISTSEDLQKALKEIKDNASLEAILKKNGCGASADEFAKFVRAQSEGEIDDDESSAVAGGIGRHYYWEDGQIYSGDAPKPGQTIV